MLYKEKNTYFQALNFRCGLEICFFSDLYHVFFIDAVNTDFVAAVNTDFVASENAIFFVYTNPQISLQPKMLIFRMYQPKNIVLHMTDFGKAYVVMTRKIISHTFC